MWREYDEQGFLVYSFAETVAAMHPYYVMRVTGGLFYLTGGLLMAWNVYQTIRGQVRNEAPMDTALPPQGATAQPAE